MNPAAVALVLSLATAPGSAQADPPASALQADDMALRRGEVRVDDIRADETGGAARVRALMWGPATDVWAVVVSCDMAFRYLRGLQACEVLEDTGETARVRQAVRRHWLLPTTEFVYRVRREPYREMSLSLERGELDALEGAWRFEPAADGALRVTHEIRVAPRFPAPRWLVRAAVRRDLPDMLACIRGLAGASLDEAMAASDLARCEPPPQR